MPLTDPECRNTAPPTDKARIRLADGGGLYLEITKAGGRYWYWKYRFAGKEKRLSLGAYPDVKLKQVRNKRDSAKGLLQQGVDPVIDRKVRKLSKHTSVENAFEAVAREWIEKYAQSWAPSHTKKVRGRLENDVFPWLGARSCAEITAAELLMVLRRIEGRGAIETAHRTKQHCGQVFRYAIATGRAERDPSADLKGASTPKKPKHFATLTKPDDVGALLRAIDGYDGTPVTKAALQLAPLLFVRPGELRHAEWANIDLDEAEWRIPAEKMKMKAPHIVPLSDQVVTILTDLFPITGRGQYVFPGVRSPRRAMSENTVNAALRRMGYEVGSMTGHGFRSMASTLLNEQGWNRDAIERQLAHAERDGVRAAYNYAEYLPERIKMMQAWADYLESLKRGADVVPLRSNQ